jgi:hypothetical protein
VLVPGCVKLCQEMMPEKLRPFLRKMKSYGWLYKKNCSLSEVMNFWLNLFLSIKIILKFVLETFNLKSARKESIIIILTYYEYAALALIYMLMEATCVFPCFNFAFKWYSSYSILFSMSYISLKNGWGSTMFNVWLQMSLSALWCWWTTTEISHIKAEVMRRRYFNMF